VELPLSQPQGVPPLKAHCGSVLRSTSNKSDDSPCTLQGGIGRAVQGRGRGNRNVRTRRTRVGETIPHVVGSAGGEANMGPFDYRLLIGPRMSGRRSVSAG